MMPSSPHLLARAAVRPAGPLTVCLWLALAAPGCLLTADLSLDGIDAQPTVDAGDTGTPDLGNDDANDTPDVVAFERCRSGEAELEFEGAPAREGDDCGCSGALVCTLEGTLICVGDEPINACGGCGALPGEPESPCGRCGGTWTCDDTGGLLCVGDSDVNACGGCGPLVAGEGASTELGATCALGPGEEGRVRCASPTQTTCLPADTNLCGGTAPLPGRPGGTCGTCSGGRQVCDGRDALACVNENGLTNACGGCGPLAEPLGSTCQCTGTWACGDDGTQVCNGGSSNACGGCSTLRRNPGDECSPGFIVECAGPDTTECRPVSDSCEVNGVPLFSGEPCGECSPGYVACLPDGSGVCIGGVSLNACGGCEQLLGNPGESCGAFATWACEGPRVTCVVDPCFNGAPDRGETDIDCGGTCGRCSLGQACEEADDCASGRCARNRCSSPDRDNDGIVDTIDNCVAAFNPSQLDRDTDRIGDPCDPDRDGDTIPNAFDNCPDTANADQRDLDRDGVGDACP